MVENAHGIGRRKSRKVRKEKKKRESIVWTWCHVDEMPGIGTSLKDMCCPPFSMRKLRPPRPCGDTDSLVGTQTVPTIGEPPVSGHGEAGAG